MAEKVGRFPLHQYNVTLLHRPCHPRCPCEFAIVAGLIGLSFLSLSLCTRQTGKSRAELGDAAGKGRAEQASEQEEQERIHKIVPSKGSRHGLEIPPEAAIEQQLQHRQAELGEKLRDTQQPASIDCRVQCLVILERDQDCKPRRGTPDFCHHFGRQSWTQIRGCTWTCTCPQELCLQGGWS